MKLNRCLTGKCCSVILAILSVLCIAQVSCGQTPKPLLDKAQALRDVKVKSVYGGKEVVSDEGRFRIVFPDKSVEIYDEVISLHGFQLRIGKTKWSMLYSDLDYSINDNTQAREKYHRSVEAVTWNGSKLIRQNDVVLNGKLGDEVIFSKEQSKTFIRSFIVNNRLYSVSVDIKDSADESSEIPKDIQQFFDSFTFWLS